MSDEELRKARSGGETPGAVRRGASANKKWPRALGGKDAEAGIEAPAPAGETPEIVELTAEEFRAMTGEDAPSAPPETSPAPPAGEKPAAPRTPTPRKTRKRKKAKRRKTDVKSAAVPAKRKKETAEPDLDPWEAEWDYMPIRARRNGRIGCLGGLMYAVFIISLSIVLAVFLWMAASDVLALNKPSGTVEVTLPAEIFSQKQVEITDDDGNVTGTKTVSAADINAVASILRDAEIINYKWLFKLYSSFSHADQKVSPGTYALARNLDYRALVTKMRAGADSQLQTLVMFPEGFNMDQIFERLEENGVCSAEALYEAAANTEFSYAFLEGVETGDPYRLEGFLFPDTYYFYQGMQASSAINKFLSNLHYRITEEMWQKTSALNLTFHQVMTVASMIEKEAARDEERALIASVIYNRLRAGMPLQVDSTIVYARRETGDSYISPEIIQATDSPYNTYLYTGLPPGPICSPGMNSIQAALNPAETKYMYFALDVENKAVRFFVNYNEFEAFVATQDYGSRNG